VKTILKSVGLILVGVAIAGGAMYFHTNYHIVKRGQYWTSASAPPCKDKAAICDPWDRDWTNSSAPTPGDYVSMDGVIWRKIDLP
jgi:hypothetical protein